MNIKPLQIRSLTLRSNLIQGPLAGYTCAPMRVQTWRYSQPGYCSTEMVSATHLVHAKTQPKRYTYRHSDEGPLCFQLSANDSDTLGEATKKVDALGAEIIELNCGCPVQKIRAKGAGSKLLSQPENLKRLIGAMRENTDAVVSVKIRASENNVSVAQLIEQAGADLLVVHGRNWQERYDVDCRYDVIKSIVESVSIPVIGNGDVDDAKTLQKMFETGCAGVMVARASLGQPWLFDALQNQDFILPSLREVGEIFIDHVQQLSVLDTPHRAVLQARKIGKYYARERLQDKKMFLEKLMVCTELSGLEKIVEQYFVG